MSKKINKDIHQNKPLSKSPNLNVFWVNIHNTVQIKFEQVQHFHFLSINIFSITKYGKFLPNFQNHNIKRKKTL
jgi:hypothetical protein